MIRRLCQIPFACCLCLLVAGASLAADEEIWSKIDSVFSQLNGNWGEATLVSSNSMPTHPAEIIFYGYETYVDTYRCSRYVSELGIHVKMSVSMRMFIEDGERKFQDVIRISPELPDVIYFGSGYSAKLHEDSIRTFANRLDGRRRLEFGTHGHYHNYNQDQHVSDRQFHFTCFVNA